MSIRFVKGQLNLDTSNKDDRDIDIFLSYSPMNEESELYNKALTLMPKIKGLGLKRKHKIISGIIDAVREFDKTKKQ